MPKKKKIITVNLSQEEANYIIKECEATSMGIGCSTDGVISDDLKAKNRMVSNLKYKIKGAM